MPAEPKTPDRPPRAVLLDRASIDAGDCDLTRLTATCDHWDWYPATARHEIAGRIADAVVVVTNKVPLTADLLAGAPALRLVCIAATGINNIDLAAARAQGIAVTNVTGYATPAVVQHVFALLLAWATRLPDQLRAATDGTWSQATHFCLLDPRVRELAGRTLGIVGYGELGQAVARVAAAFGMRVLIAARPGSDGPAPPGRLPLTELLPQVDVLSLHCPLTPTTRGLIGAAELALLRPDALLINTARGGIVDEVALAAALRAGRLGGAAVDVLSQEPPPPDHPLLAPDLPNLMVTPHAAWASREARQRLLDEVAANIEAFGRGELRNRVDLPAPAAS